MIQPHDRIQLYTPLHMTILQDHVFGNTVGYFADILITDITARQTN